VKLCIIHGGVGRACSADDGAGGGRVVAGAIAGEEEAASSIFGPRRRRRSVKRHCPPRQAALSSDIVAATDAFDKVFTPIPPPDVRVGTMEANIQGGEILQDNVLPRPPRNLQEHLRERLEMLHYSPYAFFPECQGDVASSKRI
jgi:hypothetical protein